MLKKSCIKCPQSLKCETFIKEPHKEAVKRKSYIRVKGECCLQCGGSEKTCYYSNTKTPKFGPVQHALVPGPVTKLASSATTLLSSSFQCDL
jgi:hypothetical protein